MERRVEQNASPHFATLARTVNIARHRGRLDTLEFEDAKTALKQLKVEDSAIRREKDDTDRAAVELMKENQRLNEELLTRNGTQPRNILNSPDPFNCIMETYLSQQMPHENSRYCAQTGLENQERAILARDNECMGPHMETGVPVRHFMRSSSELSDVMVVVDTGVVARRRRSVNNASLSRRHSTTDEDSNTLESYSAQPQHAHARRHTDMSSEVVRSAGAAAQRRRRRCLSASSVQAHRNLQGLSSFMRMLNSNNEQGGTSWLANLVLHLLSTVGRPMEAATLWKLLIDPATSERAEYFLRYTVVRDLTAQLQSPNSAQLFRNVHPFLVESTTHFLSMINKQRPVTNRRFSCPTSF